MSTNCFTKIGFFYNIGEEKREEGERFMALDKEQKREIIKKFGANENDTGSPAVQIALLTARIKYLTEHFKEHPKDFHSRRGLLKLVGRRRKLLKYLRNYNFEEYKKVVTELGLKG